MNPLNQRSSFLSSIVTGLVGWNGLIIVVALILGYSISPWFLLLLGSSLAIIQVIILRVLFFILHLHKSIVYGCIWGLISSLPLFWVYFSYFDTSLQNDFWVWLVVFSFIGTSVGGYLSYFYIDDQEINTSFIENDDVDYGRDAHWLEPFAFGAFSYLLVFFPGSITLGVYVFIIGAIVGVVSAALSHFSPDKWKNNFFSLFFLIAFLGGASGIVSGFLFRMYSGELYLNHYFLGAASGILTFLVTFIRGRVLAKKEQALQLTK